MGIVEQSRRLVPSPLGIGGLSRIELRNSLDLAGVRLNASAETLLEDPVFESDAAQTVTTIEIIECSVAELGLDDAATLTKIFCQRSQARPRALSAVRGPLPAARHTPPADCPRLDHVERASTNRLGHDRIPAAPR
jgi:hypothetical protein